MIPTAIQPVIPFAPLALVLVAFGLLTRAQVMRSKIAADLKTFTTSFELPLARKQERILAIQRARSAAEERVAEPIIQRTQPQPKQPSPAAAPAKVESRPPDPLAAEKRKLLGWLRPTLDSLQQWAQAGGLDLATLSPNVYELKAIDRAVAEATQRPPIEAAGAKIWHLLPEVLRLAIDKTDLRLDPQRSNPALQAALRNAVESTGMSMIDPRPGDPIDQAAHHTVNVVRGTPAQRETVSEVSRRGLRGRNGAILHQADVREFD